MANAETAPDLTCNSSFSSPSDSELTPEYNGHFLWLQQAVVERIGTILTDEALSADQRDASLGDLRELTGRVGIGNLAFRSLVSFARHDLQLEKSAVRSTSRVEEAA